MAKKVTESNVLYRFMCIRAGNTNYHTDFSSLTEANNYIENLNDSKIHWYGLYKVDERVGLIRIAMSGEVPYVVNTSMAKDDSNQMCKRRKSSKK